MSPLAVAVAGILLLFVLLLAFKNYAKKLTLCAICTSVSLAWISLLGASLLGYFHDKVIIAILMGQSSLGLYYLYEKHVSQRLLIFRLPLLLTLITASYTAVQQSLPLDALSLVGLAWAGLGLLYLYREVPAVQNKAKAVIECCSNW